MLSVNFSLCGGYVLQPQNLLAGQLVSLLHATYTKTGFTEFLFSNYLLTSNILQALINPLGLKYLENFSEHAMAAEKLAETACSYFYHAP